MRSVLMLCAALVVCACSNAPTPSGGGTLIRGASPGDTPSSNGGSPGSGSGSGSRSSPTGMSSSGTSGATSSGVPGSTSGAAVGGSSGMASPGTGAPPDGGATTPRLAITADFLNQTLSVVDLNKFKSGAKREDVLVGTVDLSMYTPGPLALGITPDGKTALVSISGGWLGAFTTVPAGNGTLLFVDIPTRTVTSALYTGASPMGIVITPDGKQAFVGQYSETYFAVVDIEKRTFTMAPTGASYNEELALDDTGTVGILSYGPAGDVTTFPVANPTSLGRTAGLTGDAAGVAVFPGTKKAYVVESPTTLTGNVGGHNVVDVSNPASPVATDNVRTSNAPVWYPVTAVARRKSVAFPATQNNSLSVVEMKLDGDTATQVQSITVGAASSLAYGVTVDQDGKVLVAEPEEHYVAMVDLDAATAFMVPWDITKSGPNDIKVVP
jgi:hypothetical protein